MHPTAKVSSRLAPCHCFSHLVQRLIGLPENATGRRGPLRFSIRCGLENPPSFSQACIFPLIGVYYPRPRYNMLQLNRRWRRIPGEQKECPSS